MAVIEDNQRDQIKVVYKPAYDQTGELTLAAYQQTLSYVKETATAEAKRNYAVALMNLTEYAEAPYIVQKVTTTELTLE